MVSIDDLRWREKNNYTLSKDMIRISKARLSELANNYELDMEMINDALYRSITSDVFILLESHNAVAKDTSNVLYSNGKELRDALVDKEKDYITISKSLDKIVGKKMGNQHLITIMETGSKTDMFLNEYVKDTVDSGKILSKNVDPAIDKIFNEYNEKLINELNITELGLKTLLRSKLEKYKLIYISLLINANKKIFGNFANFIGKSGDYLKNYSKIIDEIFLATSIIKGTNELVSQEQKSSSIITNEEDSPFKDKVA